MAFTTMSIIVNVQICLRHKLSFAIVLIIIIIFGVYIVQQQKIKLGIKKNLQNMKNNYDYNNLKGIGIRNSKSIIIMIKIKGYNAMVYDSQQIDVNIILFYIFGYDFTSNRFEKENELEFKFKNENVDCGDLFNEIICFDNGLYGSVLSQQVSLQTRAPHPTLFDFGAKDRALLENNYLKCVFTNKNRNTKKKTQASPNKEMEHVQYLT